MQAPASGDQRREGWKGRSDAAAPVRWVRQPGVPTPIRRLWSILSASNYSMALYGPGGTLPSLETLRIVWLPLLSRRALNLLAETGVCMSSPKLPDRPFFSWIGIKENPWDALWISRPYPRTQVPSSGWIEVTHCPLTAPLRTSAKVTHMWPAWKQQPMWLHAAPGSGVSINVGRTYVAKTYEEAAHILARLLPGESPVGRCPTETVGRLHATAAPEGYEWHAPMDERNESIIARLRPRRPRLDFLHAAREAAAIGASDGGIPPDMHGPVQLPLDDATIESLDSIQIVRHIEFHSTEPRHEIILLRQRECALLNNTTARCGRYPNLFPCDAEALARISTCRPAFTKPWTSVHFPDQLSWRPLHCLRDSECYLENAGRADEAYVCPEGQGGHVD